MCLYFVYIPVLFLTAHVRVFYLYSGSFSHCFMYWSVICDCVISLIILTRILGKVLLCSFCFDQSFNVAVE